MLLGSCCAASAGAQDRFEQLRDQDLRVASISYTLSVANGFRCPGSLSSQLGFVLHGIDQYGIANRAEAARSFNLGSQVGVMAVVAGSPAAKAGLMARDGLVSVNGRDLPVAAAPSRIPSRATVARAQQILTEEMDKGPATIRISRSGRVKDLRWTAELGCPANVELVPAAAANAWASGEAVVVSAGILEYCRVEDDLALVIAHEMAHNFLHHHHRLASPHLEGQLLLPSSDGSATMREMEEEADRLAVGIAKEAGYDLKEAGSFLRSLMTAIDPAQTGGTHPQLDRRVELLEAAIAAAEGSVPRHQAGG
ncbi:M48 family metalloprotease [Sphingosinicella rhizophila]|uniref:M48 family metalloprotease n=1 Tax=Sphingosinicella rhizophila TaxID=3050082 RepID=A0ABU3Q7I1_9SPHN|nr:M48 family metalloprotease [Sphingosinicella sp. GR2756]MDT9599362.1 M48 family metalloprotease [Sphingosinicella sp. GR2756]